MYRKEPTLMKAVHPPPIMNTRRPAFLVMVVVQAGGPWFLSTISCHGVSIRLPAGPNRPQLSSMSFFTGCFGASEVYDVVYDRQRYGKDGKDGSGMVAMGVQVRVRGGLKYVDKIR